MSSLQKSLVWIILALCVLAIPVGLFVRQKINRPATREFGLASEDASLGSLTLQFKDHIQVVRLSGMIADRASENSLFPTPGAATTAIRQLRRACTNKHVVAVLLRINSPGGTIGASQELNEAVKELRKKDKPVVVSMGDIAASGGYYVACASDRIVADPGTLTGSIGVIMDLMNFKGLADKLGVQPEVIKSGEFKDIGSPFRPMSKREAQILNGLIQDAYSQFVGAVAEGRKMELAKVRKFADGRVYSGQQAFKLGLVDQLGGYDDALITLQKICQERYHHHHDFAVDEGGSDTFMSSLLESVSKVVPHTNLAEDLLPPSMSARFYKQPLWLMQ
jgi:protease-4